MNNKTLDIVDNFAKTKDIRSSLLWGSIVEDADITIGIPVYGFNAYFKETLNSVLKQKDSPFSIQIIISDNKDYGPSPNPFVEYLEKKNIPNLAYYCTERPLNQFGNFNRVVNLCRTKYLVMIHDDDLLSGDYFWKLYKMKGFLNGQDIGMIHGLYPAFIGDSPELPSNQTVSVYRITNLMVSIAGRSLTGIPSCGYLLNCEAMREVGGFNDAFSSSGDAFPSAIMMTKGYKIYNFDYFTGAYRIGNNISLRLNVCQGFIKEDYMFYEDWQSRGGPFRKLLFKLLKNYRYSTNIDGKIEMFGSLNKDINKENLDYRGKYKRYNKYGPVHVLSWFFGKVSKVSKVLNTKKFK